MDGYVRRSQATYEPTAQSQQLGLCIQWDYDAHKILIIFVWKNIAMVYIGLCILKPEVSSIGSRKCKLSVEKHIRIPCVQIVAN